MARNKEPFEFIIQAIDVVAPAIATQEHLMPLSNLDLIQSRGCPSTYFCYKKPSDEKFSFSYVVSILKQSLAEILVTYYPLAGEMTQNAVGEPEILCNGYGVQFFQCYADVNLKDIDFYYSDENIGGKLVPIPRPQAIMTVQVTELKCGGIVVGGTFDHRLADGYSAYVFFAAWAEKAQGKPLSHQPLFSGSLLSPRQPGRYDSSIEEHYLLSKSVKSRTENIPSPTTPDHQQLSKISRTYYAESQKISQLQSLAVGGTKVEVFSAFMWKLMASTVDKCGSEARSEMTKCRLGIPVDGRARIGIGDENKAKLLARYFGNVNTIPFGERVCAQLMEKPLSWVADQVHDFLQIAKDEEFYLGLIDWLEAHRPETALPRICATDMKEEGPALIISSSLRFPVSSMNFGWGSRTKMSRHPTRNSCSKLETLSLKKL